MRKYITTIILVIVFFGLLAFFWFYESKKEEKKEEDKLSSTKTFIVWELNRDEISGLTFEHNGKVIDVSKEPDGNWKIIKPVEGKAKNDKINEILDKLSKIEGEGEEISYENLSEFGLDPPKAKATIRFRDGNSRDIIFGDKNPEETKVYAKVSDKNFVFLTSETLVDKVKISEEELKE